MSANPMAAGVERQSALSAAALWLRPLALPLRRVMTGAAAPALPLVAPQPPLADNKPHPATALPAGDWDMLFDAVVQRLRGTVARRGGVPPAVSGPVLDCALALELLHAALAQERADRLATAQALAEAQAALAAAQLELVGTRAGERRARHQAAHDSLTTLPNRRSFNARLDDDLQAGTDAAPPLAVLFLDLDGFKPINDQHGHEAGDQMLRIVADRLRHAMRAGDMVSRIGGDEFACLLKAPMGRPQLAQLAAKLFDTVSAPLRIGALQLHVRPSIGIALCPEHGHTAASLLQRADAAMYSAKRHQSGYAFFGGEGCA